MKEILLIAPYATMYDLARSIIVSRGYDNVETVKGDLEDGLRIATRAVDAGCKLVISRGGTFSLIKASVAVPIVEIQMNIYDVVANLRHAAKKNEPLAIIGFSNIIYGYDVIKEFVPQVYMVNIDSGERVEDKILECAADGVDSFAGDAVVSRACARLGFTCYLLESGENSILSAIEEARRILEASKREIEQTRRYKTLIDYVHDGVIATDSENRVIVFNSVAQEILDVAREDVIGKPVDGIPGTGNVFSEIAQRKLMVDELRRFNDADLAVSNIPIEIQAESRGSVAVFQDVTKLQNLERRIRVQLANKGFTARHTFDSIIHRSSEIAECVSVARKFSQYDSCILIEGESGVGKELFAQSIHNESKRHSAPFVAVNCAALSGSLIESELFGYVEGAFTGSRKGGQAGVFELAHKGTLFLDEIGEIPLELQGRLLRVIQEREVMRLGDNKVIPLDVRLICATNRSLKDMVHAGKFRQDLLYRVNTLSLYIPPLNRRRVDIEALAPHFLRLYSARYGKRIEGFSDDGIDYLRSYDYEGNIRELQGIIERAVIVCESSVMGKAALAGGILRETGGPDAIACANALTQLCADVPTLAELELRYLTKIFAETGESVTRTCEILGINRTTLWRKLKSRPE